MYGVKVRMEITVHRRAHVCREKKTPVRAMRFRVADDEIRQSNRCLIERPFVVLENTEIYLS